MTIGTVGAPSSPAAPGSASDSFPIRDARFATRASPDSPLPTPDLNDLLSAILSHSFLDAADSLGLSLTAFLALLRRPDIRHHIDTLRRLEADHFARAQQAARQLAMDALRDTLAKRHNPGADPAETRRAASALARLSLVGRVSRPVTRLSLPDSRLAIRDSRLPHRFLP